PRAGRAGHRRAGHRPRPPDRRPPGAAGGGAARGGHPVLPARGGDRADLRRADRAGRPDDQPDRAGGPRRGPFFVVQTAPRPPGSSARCCPATTWRNSAGPPRAASRCTPATPSCWRPGPSGWPRSPCCAGGGKPAPPPETGTWRGGGMMSGMTADYTDPPPGDDLDRSVSGMLRLRGVVIGVLVTVFLALPAVALFGQQGLSGTAAFLVPGTVVFVVLVDRWVLLSRPQLRHHP